MGDHKKTHCRRGHEFTPKNVVLRANGERQCRMCKYVRNRAERKEATRRARAYRGLLAAMIGIQRILKQETYAPMISRVEMLRALWAADHAITAAKKGEKV